MHPVMSLLFMRGMGCPVQPLSETATNSMAGATYFRFGAGGSFLEFAALQRGRCAISYIHPNVPTPGPPTSRAVQVNLREGRKRFQALRVARANRVRNATAFGYVAAAYAGN